MGVSERKHSCSWKRGLGRVSFCGALIALFNDGSSIAAGLPGRDAVVVTPGEEGLVGDADAASQGTIDDEQIENRPLSRPGEVLEVIPGVVVTQHSGSGKANQYFLRGFNLDHGTDFAVHIDGMPVNLPSHGHGQGYADINFLIPELVEHIHYPKGPYYADEGDFSAAGTAHVHLKRSLDGATVDFTPGSYRYLRTLASGGRAFADGRLMARARNRAGRRPMGQSGKFAQTERPGALRPGRREEWLHPERHGLLLALEFHRPDPVARCNGRHRTALRRDRPHGRRTNVALQPVLPVGAEP